MLLLRLNMEGEVTAGLILQVLPPQVLLMVLGHVTFWVTWHDVVLRVFAQVAQ